MVLVVAMGCCFVKLLQRPNKVSGGWQALNVLLLKKRGMKQVIQPVSAIGKLGPLDLQWLVVFGITKLEMRMLEGLPKHLEHINEKLFCPVLLDCARGRVHPCCFRNKTGIRSDPRVAWIADNTAHVLRTPWALIAAKATDCVWFWYWLLAIIGEDVSQVHY
jgi:hypothetical protein